MLEGARQRERRALETLFERYFDRVYGLTFRLLGDRTLAEDLTQEVFLKVYRAIHRLDPARDPEAWLIAIAANACRDHWRSRAHRMARRTRSLEGEPVRHIADPPDDPAASWATRKRERLVREAIDRLPESLRMAVVLHDFADLPHDQVAAISGVSYVAARKRYSRALRSLAELLEGVIDP